MRRDYLTQCVECGGTTTKQYARANKGKCKACSTGDGGRYERGDTSGRTTAEQTAEFRSVEADLDNCPY